MESPVHPLSALFAQLGLESDAPSIEQFIERHRPLAPEVKLADATFWTKAQSQLLREAVSNDADWAEVADELDALLRHAG